MNLFDRIKQFAKKQTNQIDYDEYEKVRDRELLNLRRLRRQQLERLEKEKLKKEIAEHNSAEAVAMNRGKPVSEIIKEKNKTGFFKKLSKEEYKQTKRDINRLKKSAKQKYKSEWYIKKPVIKDKKEPTGLMYQNFFIPTEKMKNNGKFKLL